MPITAPTFSVQALNPAALLANRDRGNNALDQILGQALNFVFQTQLADAAASRATERDAANATRDLERDFSGNVARGEVTQVEGPGGLPGMTVAGPPGTRFEGDSFETRGVAAARDRQEFLQTPVETIFGRETFDNVTEADRATAQGGTTSADSQLGLVKGDLEATQAIIDSLPATDQVPLQKVLDAAAESGRGFTLLEERTVTPTLPQRQAMIDADRQAIQLAKENREEVAGHRETILSGSRKILADGTSEDYTYFEANIMALDLAGEPLTETQEDQVDDLMEQRGPKLTLPDIQEQLSLTVRNTSGIDVNATNEFIDWIRSRVTDGDGNVTNEAVRNEIVGAGRELDDDPIRLWAGQSSSQAYRAAFALYKWVGETRSKVVNLRQSGMVYPFNEVEAMKKLQMLDPTFNDIPVVPDTGGEPASLFLADREVAMNMFRQAPAAALEGFRDELKEPDKENAIQTMQDTADSLRNSDPEAANAWDLLLDIALVNPETFDLLADSVLIVAADSVLAQPGN